MTLRGLQLDTVKLAVVHKDNHTMLRQELPMNEPTIKEIRGAAERIRSLVHRTPVLTCSALNRMCEAEIFFKCENFQKVGES